MKSQLEPESVFQKGVKRFKCMLTGAMVLAGFVLPSCAQEQPVQAPVRPALNAKKGFGTVAGRDPKWLDKLRALRASWFYGWGLDKPQNVPADIEFVPMDWGYWGNKDGAHEKVLNRAKAQKGVKTLLGFNEPDGKEQANLSVEGALEAWPQLQATNLRLGSPAAVHAHEDWMKRFMAGAKEKGFRVDFVTIHWYGGNDPNGFLGYVDLVHKLYGRPIWITEFAPADWEANKNRPNRYTPAQMADFMARVLPELNKRPYVERYAWYSAGVKDPSLGPASLFGEDGSLTDLGRLYSRL